MLFLNYPATIQRTLKNINREFEFFFGKYFEIEMEFSLIFVQKEKDQQEYLKVFMEIIYLLIQRPRVLISFPFNQTI